MEEGYKKNEKHVLLNNKMIIDYYYYFSLQC